MNIGKQWGEMWQNKNKNSFYTSVCARLLSMKLANAETRARTRFGKDDTCARLFSNIARGYKQKLFII